MGVSLYKGYGIMFTGFKANVTLNTLTSQTAIHNSGDRSPW